VAEELWESLGHSSGLSSATWPDFDSALAREDEIEVAVQVNGKLRGRIYASAGAGEAELREAALANDKVQAATAGHEIIRVIVVPGKLVSVVVR
jgi:leucyl-tRNA synthetase